MQDKTILITGAGGSIGSQIARELIEYHPKQLILLDRAENSLFYLGIELEGKVNFKLVICDILDYNRLIDIFKIYRPEIVIHAAAHKHVPLMEDNPTEAIKNNIFGTKIVADISDVFKVNKFVFISTDKAVNPSSVMGVTKRIAEIYIKNLQSDTHYSIVRFGNVLGSEGSVIQVFNRKGALGESLPVTHPEIQRYFMSIPEASRLVLEAVNMGTNGDVYVLDMGEQKKILDIAKEYAKRFKVGITFTGLRPGEKLYEELLYKDESLESTSNPRIKKCTGSFPKVDFDIFLSNVNKVKDKEQIESIFKKIVPEYKENRNAPN